MEFMTVLIYDGNGTLQYYLRNLVEQSIGYEQEIGLCKILLFVGMLCIFAGVCRFDRYDIK